MARITNRRFGARLQQHCMIARSEQYGPFRHKCRGDVLSPGKYFLERVGNSTRIEMLCSTMDLGMTGEGGNRYCKPLAGKEDYPVVALVSL